MPKVTSLGHMGFYVRDIERSVAFYRDILGLKVSDRSPRGAVFMTAQDRLAEHHELYLAPGRNDDGKSNILQQISFRCASVADVKEFYRVFIENKVPINRCVSHGNTGRNANTTSGIQFKAAPGTVYSQAFTNPAHTFGIIRRCTAFGNTGFNGTSNWSGSGIFLGQCADTQLDYSELVEVLDQRIGVNTD